MNPIHATSQIEQAKKDLQAASDVIAARHRYACGLEREWQDFSTYSRNFFLSPDGQNGELYSELRNMGYLPSGYKAPYHWGVSTHGLRIEFVEGDVYIKEIP